MEGEAIGKESHGFRNSNIVGMSPVGEVGLLLSCSWEREPAIKLQNGCRVKSGGGGAAQLFPGALKTGLQNKWTC